MESLIKEGFNCDENCYSQENKTNADHPPIACTHTYKHISQQVTDLTDSIQQETIHTMEEESSSFTSDLSNNCEFNRKQTDPHNNTHMNNTQALNNATINTKHKHKYHNTFGEANIN